MHRKSTQLPQYLAEHLELHGTDNCKVICTQPRKVSATSLAERVSEEWSLGDKTKVGAVVGYRVGAVRKSSKFSRIEYVTEGTFLSTLLQIFGGNSSGGSSRGSRSQDKGDSEAKASSRVLRDPLHGVGAIVIDEAHERSTTCDLILGMLKTHAPTKWPHLKVVITSATLDSKLFSKYFYDCPVLQIPGRMFPVSVQYLPLENSASGMVSPTDKYAHAVVKTALEIHNTSHSASGDILCFLTGQEETEKAKEKFAALNAKLKYGPVHSLALYGRQLPAEQKLVFERAPVGTRKVIFATDVAETGVTIDGVRHILDAGLCKESRYDSKRNVTVLSVQAISQSSATQRKGRAGRTAPGTCYRLYSEDDYDAMDVSQVPEVLSRPLPLTVISLLSMGLHPLHFQWIQSPAEEGLRQAMDELRYLGAIGHSDSSDLPVVTELGELTAALQVDPGMARMVYHACREGMGEAACTLVGILSVASSFFHRGSVNDAENRATADAKHLAFCHESGDLVAMYDAFCEWESLMNAYLEAPLSPAHIKVSGDGLSEQDIDENTVDTEEEDSIERELKATNNHVVTDCLKDEDEQTNNQSMTGLSGFQALVFPDTDDNASEISDDASIISNISDLTEFADLSFQEQKKSRFAASKQAKKWCRDNFINNKSMGIALSVKNDIIRQLRTFKDGTVWRALPGDSCTIYDQQISPSTVDIQRLVVKGLFLNVAIQIQQSRGYEVLRNSTPTVGFLHPGSSLSKLANSRNDEDAENMFPGFILFHTMLTTSRTFLNVITPVAEEWIREESASFFDSVVAVNMNRARCAKLLIEGLRSNISSALLGNFGESKRELETQLNCSIQYDAGRCALEAWCTPGSMEGVNRTLHEKIQSIKRISLEAVEEVVICGNTRAIFGAGGLVKSLLFGEEYVTVNISGLAANTESIDLQAYLTTSFGPTHAVTVTHPRGGKG